MYEMLKLEARAHRDQKSPRKIRNEGYVPGVIFGKGMDSVTFQVPLKDFTKFMHNSHSKVFEVEVAGYGKHLVSLENIQWDHMGSKYLHIELHKLSQHEKTVVTLPVRMVGTAPGVKAGGIVNLHIHEMDVKGLPKDFVECIEVDVSSLDINHSIHLSDLTPPKGLSWVEDGELVMVHCAAPRLEVVEEAADDTAVVAPEASVPAPSEEKKAS